MTFWWAFAAVMIVAADSARYFGRDLPWLLMPFVWVLAASAFSPRSRTATAGASG